MFTPYSALCINLLIIALLFSFLQQDFINSVSASLIGNADFHDAENANRVAISAAASEIIDFDPEFILKVICLPQYCSQFTLQSKPPREIRVWGGGRGK